MNNQIIKYNYKYKYNYSPNYLTYNINNIKIEFVKSFLKEYADNSTNTLYNYAPLINPNNKFLPVEFTRFDPIGYIKLKHRELWVYENDINNLYFHTLKKGLFWWDAPNVIWFDYNTIDTFIVYKFKGYGLMSLMEFNHDRNKPDIFLPPCDSLPNNSLPQCKPQCKPNSKTEKCSINSKMSKDKLNMDFNNLEYLFYYESPTGKIKMKWITDKNKATRFKFDKINLLKDSWRKIQYV